ncbi:Hsp20 family protein [Methanobacterium sp.]|uniref:Hsp20/alpha crystallin family protein n=2 Tax=Methanobacterium sp. TaxID=2164 RepID=UPI003C755386
MSKKSDAMKDELQKKTLHAKTKADELKAKTLVKQEEIKNNAIQVKQGALKKTADAKDSAIMKTAEIKETTTNKTSEIKENASERSAEFKGNTEKTRKQAEGMINEFITSLKDKQEEFGKTIADYTAGEKLLTDVINTENSIIIKTDLPTLTKEDVNVNITEDSVEIIAKFEEKDENLEFIKNERNYGETVRIIPLPIIIDVKKAFASFVDSVLTIELPKVQEEKINIKIE